MADANSFQCGKEESYLAGIKNADFEYDNTCVVEYQDELLRDKRLVLVDLPNIEIDGADNIRAKELYAYIASNNNNPIIFITKGDFENQMLGLCSRFSDSKNTFMLLGGIKSIPERYRNGDIGFSEIEVARYLKNNQALMLDVNQVSDLKMSDTVRKTVFLYGLAQDKNISDLARSLLARSDNVHWIESLSSELVYKNIEIFRYAAKKQKSIPAQYRCG